MNKKEFSILAAAMRTYYPRETLLPNNQAMELWYRQLEDIPYEVAEAALQKWVATNKWSPSIADLRELSFVVTHGDIPDWGEAWADVVKVIQRFGWYHPTEAMECLAGVTREVVERLGYAKLCLSENQDADRANFRVLYTQLAERKLKADQIPERLSKLIAGMQTGEKMLEGGEIRGQE